MSIIPLFIKDGRACGFDPVEKAGLSVEQTKRLEQFEVAVSRLKDGNGLTILFDMDNWLCAQMVAAIYNADGSARDYREYIDSLHTNLG